MKVRWLAPLLVAGGLAGCAAAGTERDAASAGARRPPRASCPSTANIDLAALARAIAADPVAEARRARIRELLAPAVVPDGAARRPPADAHFVIRVRVPPGGLWSADDRSVVWREADGSWWFWRRTLDVREPQPPMPGETARTLSEEERFPATAGRLGPAQAARMEAAYANPCRFWEPDEMPYQIPLRRAEQPHQAPVRLCPPDGASYLAEITERGRPPRIVYAACINDTATFTLISTATYAAAADPG